MRRHISPALVISTVALFFSLAGAGLAASHYLITSLSQIAPQVRHELRGPQGPVGPRGAVGPVGPQGAVGPQGVPGVQEAFVSDAGSDANFIRSTGSPVIVPPGGEATATDSCDGLGVPAAIIAGGFDAQPGLSVYSSTLRVAKPTLTTPRLNEWSVSATNPTTQPLTLTATATCVGS